LSSIGIVDNDQAAIAGGEPSRCSVKLEWRCIFQESDGQAIRVTEVTQQLRPSPSPALAICR
jgi:hypothetical protein